MPRDSIVDEVRAARDAFAKEHDYDVKQIVEALRLQPIPRGSRVVSLPPKRLTEKAKAGKSA